MSKLTKRQAQRIAGALKKDKRKNISLDMLSNSIGIYPDALGQQLLPFSPMILMDPSINCKQLLPQIEDYIKNYEPSVKKKAPATPAVRKKDMEEFSGITDFVYKRMTTAGGLVDPSFRLGDKDLKILHKLVCKEVSERRKAAKSKAKKAAKAKIK